MESMIANHNQLPGDEQTRQGMSTKTTVTVEGAPSAHAHARQESVQEITTMHIIIIHIHKTIVIRQHSVH